MILITLTHEINIFLFSDVSLVFSQRSGSRVRRIDFDTPYAFESHKADPCHPSHGFGVLGVPCWYGGTEGPKMSWVIFWTHFDTSVFQNVFCNENDDGYTL